MKLADISNGPDWVIWVVFVIFAVISAVLISGRGSGIIAGYNTASKEEKMRYDEKKLCKITGGGMAVITALVFIMGVFENVLPAFFVYVFLAVVLIDTVVIMILSNTICKIKKK